MSTSENAAGTLSAEERLHRVEVVRAKAHVSFEEARDALEASGYDMLDALVALERQGKAAGQTASYSTADTRPADDAVQMSQAQSDYENKTKHLNFERGFSRCMDALKRVLRKSIDVSFVVSRRGRQLASVPLLVFILLAIVFFWVIVPLVIVGLFFEFRYRLEGVGAVTVDVNRWSEKASEGAEALKRDVMDTHDDAKGGQR